MEGQLYNLNTMEEEQKKYYSKVAEKMFAIPAEKRGDYLELIKKRDREFYERIEHLSKFLTSREDELENYARHRIRKILVEIDKNS
jgi:hypothetical protein